MDLKPVLNTNIHQSPSLGTKSRGLDNPIQTASNSHVTFIGPIWMPIYGFTSSIARSIESFSSRFLKLASLRCQRSITALNTEEASLLFALAEDLLKLILYFYLLFIAFLYHLTFYFHRSPTNLPIFKVSWRFCLFKACLYIFILCFVSIFLSFLGKYFQFRGDPY